MGFEDSLRRYRQMPAEQAFDASMFPLQALFPLRNDGVIKPNVYYRNDTVHRYLCMQASVVLDALNCFFQGGVYFLWDCKRNLLKIGCARDVEKRVRQLINDAKAYAMNDALRLIAVHPTSPALIPGLEKKYHALFEEYAYRYEWFRLSPEQFENTLNVAREPFATRISTYFTSFWLLYTAIDFPAPQLKTILDVWPYAKKQARAMLCMDALEDQELTLLVQDHRGNIIPFGWRQDDMEYLNGAGIWENPRLLCFQKLRMLALNDARKQKNFADGLLFL